MADRNSPGCAALCSHTSFQGGEAFAEAWNGRLLTLDGGQGAVEGSDGAQGTAWAKARGRSRRPARLWRGCWGQCAASSLLCLGWSAVQASLPQVLPLRGGTLGEECLTFSALLAFISPPLPRVPLQCRPRRMPSPQFCSFIPWLTQPPRHPFGTFTPLLSICFVSTPLEYLEAAFSACFADLPLWPLPGIWGLVRGTCPGGIWEPAEEHP